ncbi:MAG: iron chaperone [Eubacteriales bacterium]
METFKEYLDTIENPENRMRVEQVLGWVQDTFPQLEKKIAWSQPMFTDHGTFIIGFSSYKKHMNMSPEKKTLDKFSDEIKKRGYTHTQQLVQFPWDKEIDYNLLEDIIKFNISDKKDCQSFWRK